MPSAGVLFVEASSLQKAHAGGLHRVRARARAEPGGMVMRVDPGNGMKVGPDKEV